MRCYILLFALSVTTIFSSAHASMPYGNKNYYLMIFPKDINKFPILFEKFEKITEEDKAPLNAHGYDCSFKDIEPEKVNALIQKFIDTHLAFEHKLVATNEIDNLSSSTYKYVVKTKLMEFESVVPASNHVVSVYRVFKSVFYFTDRTTGKDYTPFYNPKQKSISLSNRHLPAYPPTDKQFFKVLSKYIAQLNGQ